MLVSRHYFDDEGLSSEGSAHVESEPFLAFRSIMWNYGIGRVPLRYNKVLFQDYKAEIEGNSNQQIGGRVDLPATFTLWAEKST